MRRVQAAAVDEVRQQPQTGVAALLGVELRRPQRARFDRSREAATVGAPRGDDTVVGRIRRERMHEVQPGRAAEPGGESARGPQLERVPADLRKALGVGESGDAAGDDTEAGHVRRFVAAVEQHLHADAHTEERASVGRRFLRHRLEAGVPKGSHARAERAHAGQHDGVRGGDRIGVGGQRRVGAEVLQRLFRRPQVPDPVVDDRDHRCVRRVTTCPSWTGRRSLRHAPHRATRAPRP